MLAGYSAVPSGHEARHASSAAARRNSLPHSPARQASVTARERARAARGSLVGWPAQWALRTHATCAQQQRVTDRQVFGGVGSGGCGGWHVAITGKHSVFLAGGWHTFTSVLQFFPVFSQASQDAPETLKKTRSFGRQDAALVECCVLCHSVSRRRTFAVPGWDSLACMVGGVGQGKRSGPVQCWHLWFCRYVAAAALGCQSQGQAATSSLCKPNRLRDVSQGFVRWLCFTDPIHCVCSVSTGTYR